MANRLVPFLLSLTMATVVAFPVPTAFAQPKTAANPAQKSVPTTVTAQRMQYDANKQSVVFEGDVYVKRPDFELWSVKLTLHLGKAKEAKGGGEVPGGMDAGEIERIVAEKNVRMVREGRNGTCQKATYTTHDGLMIMEGSPVLFDKENVVKGETIYFYTRENRSEVHGGTSRPVEAVFTSSSSAPMPAAEKSKESE